MAILLSDLEQNIDKIFNTSKVLSVNSVWEKSNNSSDWKLVIFLNKILYDDIYVIYTKLIFIADENKTKLTKNFFSYLYDINCEWVRVDFDDLDDAMLKIKNIFEEKNFGKDIKVLSEFMKSPAVLINEWLGKNEISDISVTGFNYEPKVKILPCKSLFFSFAIDLSNNTEIGLEIKKENEHKYFFKFQILDNYYTVEQENLNNLVSVIGETLKNKVK